MSFGAISEMGYVALRTQAFDESIEVATQVLGLQVTKNTGDRAYLTSGANHHELVYVKSDVDGVDHVGLVAESDDALDAIRQKAKDGGWRILTTNPIEEAIANGFSFVGPEDYTFHVYRGIDKVAPTGGGFGPDRYGHVNIHPKNVEAMKEFLIDVFGFRVSDAIGKGFAYFLRCNSDHHGIALIQGVGRLHHHAWQTQNVADLGRLGDRLDAVGRRLLWGPVRHGAGHNIAAYYAEPNGTVVEVYTDLEQIYDDSRPPTEWELEDPRWANRWGVYRGENFHTYGTLPVGPS